MLGFSILMDNISRLKDVSQAKCLENERALIDMGITIPDAWKQEFYTEEHEKLLGDCEAKWTLNMDGFGEDGERLYNPDGQPCHQCRLILTSNVVSFPFWFIVE